MRPYDKKNIEWQLAVGSIVTCFILYSSVSNAAIEKITITHRDVVEEAYDEKYTDLLFSQNVHHSCDGNVDCSGRYEASNGIKSSGNVTIFDGETVKFRAPTIRLKPGFKASKGAHFSAASIPSFDVHFVNMVDPATVKSKDSAIVYKGIFDPTAALTQEQLDEFCRNETAILNHHFVDEYNNQLVRFVFKDAQMWENDFIEKDANTNKENSKLGYCYYNNNGSAVKNETNNCHKPDVLFASEDKDYDGQLGGGDYRDRTAINIVFFRNPKNRDSAGGPNLSDLEMAPLMLLDYRRINENFIDANNDGVNDTPDSNLNSIADDDPDRDGVEEHEMGHIFGLHHVWRQSPESTNGVDPWYNIMMSSGLADGSTFPELDDCVFHTKDCDSHKDHKVCQHMHCDTDMSKPASVRCLDFGNLRDGDDTNSIDGFMIDPFVFSYSDSNGDEYWEFQRYWSGDSKFHYQDARDGFGQVELILNFVDYYDTILR